MPTDEEEEAAMEALLAGGDLDAIRASAEPVGDGELAVDERGNDISQQVVADHDKITFDRNALDDANQDELESGSEVQPAAPEEPAAEEPDAPAVKEPVLPSAEDRKRLYLHDGIPARRQLELQIAASNPDMPMAQVLELADKHESGDSHDPETVTYDELPAVEKIKIDTQELADIRTKMLESDESWTHDEEWKSARAALLEDRDNVMVRIAANQLAAQDEAAAEHDSQNAFNLAEAEAIKAYPDLVDAESDLFAAVSGRIEQIKALQEQGRPLPTYDGKALDPDSPNFPILIAREQGAKVRGKQAPVAKPGAAAAAEPVRRFTPVPGAAASQHARTTMLEGQQAPSLQSRAKSVNSEADLDALIAEVSGGRQWGRRSVALADN